MADMAGMITFRLIAFSALDERDRAKARLTRYQASRRAKFYLGPSRGSRSREREGWARASSPFRFADLCARPDARLVFLQPMHASRRRLFIDHPNYGQLEMRVIVFSG